MANEYPDPTNFVSEARKEAHFAERSRRGFSSEDWWNFDTYIAWVIANAVEKMKADGSTAFNYPGVPEDQWEARTNAEYDIMIKGFSRWCSGVYDFAEHPETDNIAADLEAALHVFKNRFTSLWD